MSVLVGAIILLLLVWVGVLLAFARPLAARWREPVFRYPVIVFESDDWGAGPLEQAQALAEIATVLRGFRDCMGRPPVMTLGMVFEVPDRERMAREEGVAYHAIGLQDDRFADLRSTIHQGVDEGLFVPHLHGQCHYWPPALLAAAASNEAVSTWLAEPGLAWTETLPSPLQSRWVDASRLPSCALDPAQIEAAALQEAAQFQHIFGYAPVVAVATTFVWDDAVEAAWHQAGVKVVITPGRRATCRDAAGRPGCVDRSMLSGERSGAGQVYLVRDVFFEPKLGHGSERLLAGLTERTRQGRACLVEIHRFNFLTIPESRTAPAPSPLDAPAEPSLSLNVLQAGIETCLTHFPQVRFVTPEEIVCAIEQDDDSLIEHDLRRRLHAWLQRLHEIPKWSRAVRLTGLLIPLKLIERVV